MYTSTQVHKYTNTKAYKKKIIQIHMYTKRQVRKFR